MVCSCELVGSRQASTSSSIINHQFSSPPPSASSIIIGKDVWKNVNSSWQSHDRNVPMFFQHVFWLVVYLPLWKIWVRQLGWWHSQYMEKIWCSKPPTSYPILFPIKTHKTTLNHGFKPPTSYVFLCFVAPLILPIDPHGLIIHILTAIQVQPLQRW